MTTFLSKVGFFLYIWLLLRVDGMGICCLRKMGILSRATLLTARATPESQRLDPSQPNTYTQQVSNTSIVEETTRNDNKQQQDKCISKGTRVHGSCPIWDTLDLSIVKMSTCDKLPHLNRKHPRVSLWGSPLVASQGTYHPCDSRITQVTCIHRARPTIMKDASTVNPNP